MERVENLEEVIHGPEEFFEAIDEMCSTCSYSDEECNNCPIPTVCTVFTDASFLLKLKLGDIIMLSTDDGVKPYTIVYDSEQGYSIISILTGVVVSSSILAKHDLIVELVTMGDILSVITGEEICTFMNSAAGVSINREGIESQLVFD